MCKANVAAGMVLPGCQDTGTAIVMGKRGQNVWTDGNDAEALSLGVFNTYTKRNLRYSQVAPLDMFNEGNTKSTLTDAALRCIPFLFLFCHFNLFV